VPDKCSGGSQYLLAVATLFGRALLFSRASAIRRFRNSQDVDHRAGCYACHRCFTRDTSESCLGASQVVCTKPPLCIRSLGFDKSSQYIWSIARQERRHDFCLWPSTVRDYGQLLQPTRGWCLDSSRSRELFCIAVSPWRDLVIRHRALYDHYTNSCRRHSTNSSAGISGPSYLRGSRCAQYCLGETQGWGFPGGILGQTDSSAGRWFRVVLLPDSSRRNSPRFYRGGCVSIGGRIVEPVSLGAQDARSITNRLDHFPIHSLRLLRARYCLFVLCITEEALMPDTR